MQGFFDLIVSLYSDIFVLLNSVALTAFGYSVSIGSILIAFLAIGFVINIFWKGARA